MNDFKSKLVGDVNKAFKTLFEAGAEVLAEPFEIQIGRCAVLKESCRNVLTILDLSKGLLKMDGEKNVIGNKPVT